MSGFRCTMAVDREGHPVRQDSTVVGREVECGAVARRHYFGGDGEHDGICDNCFERIAVSEDWTREEAETQYPLIKQAESPS